MTRSRERPDLRGTYRLTIGGGTCDGGAPFPEALRTRTYRAVMYQESEALLLDLKDATFATVTATGLSGTYDGAIKVYNSLPVGADLPRASCRSKTHKFILER